MAAIPESFKKKLARDAELVTLAAAENAKAVQVFFLLLLFSELFLCSFCLIFIFHFLLIEKC
jgi:hypothetical protein